jgi:redox-sensitive bicupin YhaK (pirin superfamily)
MSTKTVQQILPPPPAHMVGDGFRVHNFFPSGYNISNRRMSPFFMLDYNSKIEFSPSDIPRGVGVHPHRGFETVTIAYHGKVAHGDSYGNSGVIGEGEVQWMTAASGILHKEHHEEEFSKTGGLFQMVQLWVNLPARDKMSMPKYQGITKEMMGRYPLPDGSGEVEIIAGSYEGVKGPAFTFTPIEMYNLRLKKGAKLTLDFPETDNTGLLMIEGSALVNDETLAQDHFSLMANEGTTFTVEALEDAVILVLSGTPIDEPIANYGPFLMNTTEELQQAIKDFNTGKFGTLED